LTARAPLVQAHAIIYVVDAAEARENASRLDELRASLRDLMENQRARDKPLLVFANKQDLPQAASAAELAVMLALVPQGASAGASPATSFKIQACRCVRV
jgi:ADP-ribosylation factor-like protein 13B